MAITAQMINSLRERTGVGMMKCKEALTTCDGDVEKAVDLLRKQGAAVAAKRADKEAKEGLVYIGSTESKVFSFELTAETDFVSKGEDFLKLVEEISGVIKANDVSSIEDILKQKVGALTISERIAEVLAKLGEKIEIRKFASLPVEENSAIAFYSHLGGKIGTIVKLVYEGSASKEAVQAVAKIIALHVTASNPMALDETGLSPELVEKEKEIAKEQIVNEGKTKPDFVDRAVEGRVKKALKQLCLMDQEFYTDAKKIVRDVLTEEQKKLGVSKLEVAQFVRFEKGK
ncbi:MAG: translation elongation factor Ts [Fibromonadaceae bacterium]|jgi:elongation factor Ts|nr:translation elongation factor Ts [Fibromonadaceae bacterium]